MTLAGWAGVIAVLVFVGLIGYWLLIITEGTYLGQSVVTLLYDLVAARYDNIKGFDPDIEAVYLGRPFASELANIQANLVLDVGTGTGRLPLTLIEQPRFQGRIVGVDASEQMLRIAAEKLGASPNRCWLVHQTALRLPFLDASFDAVAMLEMLEFTPDPAAALNEAVRVLRPGGCLLTTRRTGLDAKLMPGKTYSVEAFHHLLADLGLEQIRIDRWQVDYDLVWAVRPGKPIGKRQSHPLEVLRCAACGNAAYDQCGAELVCASCGHKLRCCSCR